MFTVEQLEQLIAMAKSPAYQLLLSKRSEMTQRTGAALQPIVAKQLESILEAATKQ